MVNLGNDWDELLKGEFEKPYYLQLREFLKGEYSTRTIYPDQGRLTASVFPSERVFKHHRHLLIYIRKLNQTLV